MVWRDAQIPEVYRGLIVGKGADKLKELQVEFNVWIQVPRGKKEGPVMVEGAKADVEACIGKMHSKIENHSRSAQRTHSKGKGGKGGKGKGKAKSQSPTAPTCFLCNTEVSSLSQAAQHLRGQKHRMNVVEERPEFAERFEREHFGLADLEEVLLEPEIAEFHRELNFKVDEILSAIPAMQLKAEKLEEVNDEIAMLIEDPNWLQIKSRVVVHWDDTRKEGCKIHKLTKAPYLREMLERCSLKEPPRVKIPALPAPLPQVKPMSFASNSLTAAHKYPAAPGSCRLGIVIMEMLGIDLSNYDFVCGTSFIKALAGDNDRIRDTYYIQHFGETACVLHVPTGFHGQNDAGHAVEMLLCGDPLPGATAKTGQHMEVVNVNLVMFHHLYPFIEGSLEVKLPTIWTDEKQSRAEADRGERLEERRVEEKESGERRCRCAKR